LWLDIDREIQSLEKNKKIKSLGFLGYRKRQGRASMENKKS
jgi:hypothetical protein